MKFEFVFFFEATSHGVWHTSFIFGLIDYISRPLTILCDNLVATLWLRTIKVEVVDI